MGEVQLNSFMPPQATDEQYSQKSSVTFTLQSLGVGRLPKRFAEFLDALDAPDADGTVWTQKTAIGSFVREPPHGSAAQIDSSGQSFRDSRCMR